MSENEDLVLKALLTTAAKIEPDFPEELLRDSYAIESQFLFADEAQRSQSMQDLKKRLEAYVDKVVVQ